MKKFYSLLMVLPFIAFAQTVAFGGGDFEDFSTFEASLNSFGLKPYATQGVGQGVNGSNSLNIVANTSGNDYVFTAVAPDNVPADLTAITFMMKGESPSKSISINVYKAEGGYYKFNLGEVYPNDVIIEPANSNQYSGFIDTEGSWVKVTLNLEGITDYQTTAGEDFLAFKIGKESDFFIDVDNFYMVAESLGTVDFNSKQDKVKVAISYDNLIVQGKDVKSVVIYNTSGQKVSNSTYTGSLAKGTYIAVIEDVKGNKSSVKFIK